MENHTTPKFASIGQEGLWSLELLEKPGPAFNTSYSTFITGEYSENNFKDFFNYFINKHSICKATFKQLDGRLHLIENGYPSLFFNSENIQHINNKETELTSYVTSLHKQLFNLEIGPLFKVHFLKLSDQKVVLLVCVHHLITDGFSYQILINELLNWLDNPNAQNTKLIKSYSEFCHWQQNLITSKEGSVQKEYWQKRLSDHIPDLFRNLNKKYSENDKYKGSVFQFKIDKKLTKQIKELTTTYKISVFSFFMTAYQIILHKHFDESNIVICHPSSGRLRTTLGRKRSDYNDNFGYFVNPLLFKNQLNTNTKIKDLLINTNNLLIDDFKHQDYPFSNLYNDLKLFQIDYDVPQVLINFQKRRNDKRDLSPYKFKLDSYHLIESGNLKFEPFPIPQQLGSSDLEWEILESNNEIYCHLKYRYNHFNDNSIRKLSEQILFTIESICKKQHSTVSNINITPPSEKNKILAIFNKKITCNHNNQSLITSLKKIFIKNHNKYAIIFNSLYITYKELDEKSDILAHNLLNKGIKKNDPLVLLFDKSPEYIIAILASIKLGTIFIPIDIDLPPDRIKFIISETNPKLIVSNKKVDNLNKDIHSFCFSFNNLQYARKISLNVPTNNKDKPMYMIFTSGSTGKPKGAINTGNGLLNMINSVSDYMHIKNEKVLQFASYSFDASIFEIFLGLLTGSSLTIIPKNIINNLEQFRNFIDKNHITTVVLPPSYLQKLNNYKFKHLKNLLTAGESPILNNVKFYSKFLNYFNAYGPTETSVCASIYKVKHESIKEGYHIPIGSPINNINIKILDKNNNLCPINFPGEICISGIGVGLGYLNRPELTKEKFIEDPFLPGVRMYKTGDIGKWDEDGNVIFLGRMDNQVKVNGFRIELEEIENKLLEINNVIDVLVAAYKENNSTMIISFIKVKETCNEKEIKNKLSDFLPYYMIPSEIIFVNEFPLTTSGKKDKKLLLSNYKNSHTTSNTKPLNSDIIDSVKKIWSEVLFKTPPSSDSNFFDMGGNSIQVIELKNKFKKHTGIEIEVADLFKYTTINSQAKLIHEMSVNLISNQSTPIIKQDFIRKKSKDIAVIGMAGKFPGAENIDELWKNLIEGKESISTFSENELLNSGISNKLISDKNYIRSKGIINDADMFDAEFFGYSPRDAELIDPQQRIFLECSYNALEDAGYYPDKYNGKIGIFASSSHNSYLTNNILKKHDLYGKDFHSILTGNEKDFIATRVAYKLNLKGPAQTIQTACSSSLVGIHYACESIINGSSDIAMAGGVSITLPIKSGYHYTPEGIGSPDGHCRPFDYSSNGTVPGNGVAVVVLKSLEDAQRDGDHIYAIIKGSAINNDGNNKIGYTAPSVTGQEDVVRSALLRANIKPEMISYIETHGTGTKLGDPIEIKALVNTFGKCKEHYCSIGSIKANIGHLDAAAGVTGFIKTALTLYNKQIPPNINFSKPNSEIDFNNTPFYINTELISWPDKTNPQFAGVSSLGLGGTNAHVILQSPPEYNATKEKTTFTHKFNRKKYWIESDIKSEFNSPKRSANPNEWLYAPIWKPTVLTNINYLLELKKQNNTWLLFKDENHIGDEIIWHLKKAENTVIVVSFRKSYSESNLNYSINPYNKEDYDKLFLSLNKKQLLPNHIIHLPLITKDRLKSFNENNLKPISYLGFFSLLFTVKSLQHIDHHNCKISVISDHVFSVNGEDWINPLKSTIIGPVNVIPQEHPGITCQHIDISLDTKNNHKKQISEYIIHDLLNFAKEQTIAYRNHRRWVKSYEKLRIEPGEVNLKNGNTYLITGGLGGIGLKTALSIASTHNVTFILSGKNVLPPEDRWDHILEKYKDSNDPLLKKIIKIKKIRSLGSKVITLCIDIQNRVEFSKTLENIEKHHGKINGVIHAAGTSGNQLISTKTIEDVEQVFDPKVRGTLYLQSYFSHHKLDFFILFSSLSSISGGIEQVAYSSANAFLDAVAAHNFSDRHLQTLAINWPGWKDTGMTLKMKNYENIKHLQNLEISNIITPEEGLETLKLCLSLGPTYRLIVSPLDFNDWRMSINKNLEKEVLDIKNTQKHDRPDLSTDLLPPQNREEGEMVVIWENILHISPIGINDNFFDLGGHSLLGLELLAQIAKIKKCPLQLNDLYDHPTVSSIVKLIKHHSMLNPFAEFRLKRNTDKSTNLIVPLNSCTGTKSLYLFQPAGVNVYYYHQLAETISDDICIYGVRLTDLEEGHNIESSIEKIAERCKDNIINHSDKNSFNLAGSSFGGVVAYEVAQQLINKNKEINFISLFDSPGPNHLPVEPKDDAEILYRIFSQWIPLSLSTLKHEKTFDNQCRYIMELVEQESETGLLITPDQIQLLLSISKNSIIALNNYKPKEYNGDLLFIKPLDFHPNYDKNPERAWHDLINGKFTIKNVPGDHLSMNIQPNVHHIGKIISQELL